MVNTQTFLPSGSIVLAMHNDRTHGHLMGHRFDVLIAPVTEDGLFVGRSNAQIFVAINEAVGAHTEDQAHCSTHDQDQWIGTGVA